MSFGTIEDLHYHTQKPTIVKLIFSIIVSIILLSIIQPIWIFDITVNIDNINTPITINTDTNTDDNNNLIKKELNIYKTLPIFILFIVVIYKFVI